MKASYGALAPDYTRTLATARVIPARAALIDSVARRLVNNLDRYTFVEAQTHVPAVWLAPIFERESSSRFTTYFGNGDPLNRVTTHVPRGRGPFYGPRAWENGAIDALRLDRVDSVTDWTMEMFCYQGEAWNGFGPRAHGIHTGYLWGGMTPYTGGKYVADGVWDPRHFDEQLGIVPIALRMMELRPDLALPGAPTSGPAKDVEHPAPAAHPYEGVANARWTQHAMNQLRVAGTPIAEDNNYGRATARAVHAFQVAQHIQADGIAGPMTVARIKQALQEAGL